MSIVMAAGLQNLTDTILTNWLGPVFILGVAAFALIFIKDRAWMKLIGFIGIAAVVGVLIYAGGDFFGPDGAATGTAKELGKQIDQ